MPSVVLIGMPGVGKSTIGVLLAKELALNFVDTDLLIQQREQKTLQQIVDESGYAALRQLEENVILEQRFSDSVVATGGSAVYGRNSMEKLKRHGTVLYLSCGVEELLARITNYDRRGIAAPPEQDFGEMAAEREALYKHYADLEISTQGFTLGQVVENILVHPSLVKWSSFPPTSEGGQDKSQ